MPRTSKKRILINEKYPDVIKLIEQGFTICESLDMLKICRTAFYKCISKEQKLELRMTKTSNALYYDFDIRKNKFFTD
jgi:hypothetical protein